MLPARRKPCLHAPATRPPMKCSGLFRCVLQLAPGYGPFMEPMPGGVFMPSCHTTRVRVQALATCAALLALTLPTLAHSALTGAAFDQQIARIKGLERAQVR